MFSEINFTRIAVGSGFLLDWSPWLPGFSLQRFIISLIFSQGLQFKYCYHALLRNLSVPVLSAQVYP